MAQIAKKKFNYAKIAAEIIQGNYIITEYGRKLGMTDGQIAHLTEHVSELRRRSYQRIAADVAHTLIECAEQDQIEVRQWLESRKSLGHVSSEIDKQTERRGKSAHDRLWKFANLALPHAFHDNHSSPASTEQHSPQPANKNVSEIIDIDGHDIEV